MSDLTHSQYVELLKRARTQIILDVRRGNYKHIDTLLNSAPQSALKQFIDELTLTDVVENY